MDLKLCTNCEWGRSEDLNAAFRAFPIFGFSWEIYFGCGQFSSLSTTFWCEPYFSPCLFTLSFFCNFLFCHIPVGFLCLSDILIHYCCWELAVFLLPASVLFLLHQSYFITWLVLYYSSIAFVCSLMYRIDFFILSKIVCLIWCLPSLPASFQILILELRVLACIYYI